MPSIVTSIVTAAVVSTVMVASMASIVMSVVVAMLFVSDMARMTVALAIRGYVDAVVPLILHEVHRHAAGLVVAAMRAPSVSVRRRYAQVDRTAVDNRSADNHRLRVNQLWPRCVTEIDASVVAGITNMDRHTDIRSRCATRPQGQYETGDLQNPVHCLGSIAVCDGRMLRRAGLPVAEENVQKLRAVLRDLYWPEVFSNFAGISQPIVAGVPLQVALSA